MSPVALIPQPSIVVQQPAVSVSPGGASSTGAASRHRVVHAFQQEEEGELTVQVGDAIRVISEAGGWTKVARVADGKEGLVPSWAVAATTASNS